MLQINHLKAAYLQHQPILVDINLKLHLSEKVAIIGQNGAGKSTIGKAIMGMLPYIDGEIEWMGEDITILPTRTRISKGIGYFMQGGRVFSHLDALENIKMACLHLPIEERQKQLDKTISYIDLFQNSQRAKLQATNLSGGEKHILALAMVIAASPNLSLLIADEPSAGLSPLNVDKMYDLLGLLQKDLNFSLLLIEQNLERAKKYCEKSYIVKNGYLYAS